jgi:membrane-bound lytic murein transglycosylase D
MLTTWYGKNTLDIVPFETYSVEDDVTSSEQVSTGSIWSTLSSGFKLDHRTNSTQVKAEIRKLQANQQEFFRILKAAGPYIYFIHTQTQLRGLPSEMALIPVIESEFNPNDYSTQGATGLWQLMSGTARGLGIKVISGYDGRRSVPASTRAALAYLNDLGNYFKGNWYLALAAYNAGQGRVDQAIRRAGSRSFWSLPVPKETKFYVPKLLAVAAMVANPEKYGVELPPINNQPYFVELKLKKVVNLEQMAKSLGVSIDIMRKLNPDYKTGQVVAKNGVYSFLVPVDKLSTAKLLLAGNIMIS